MEKTKIMLSGMLSLAFAVVFPMSVLANSSWHWISETRPYDVLPFVVAVTLVIEFFAIYFIAKVKAIPKLIFFVILANALSFASPYLFLYIVPSLYTASQSLEHTPYYTVGLLYLFNTLVIEIPVMYFTMTSQTSNTRKLLWVIAGSNVVTTLVTAIVERTVCTGSW